MPCVSLRRAVDAAGRDDEVGDGVELWYLECLDQLVNVVGTFRALTRNSD